MAAAVVEIDGEIVEHSTGGHVCERTALVLLADWLLMRRGASSTRLETASGVALMTISDAA